MIIWAGTSNQDVGMVIEHYPKIILPKYSQEVQQVPGRNGDIVLPNGSFENYDQEYSAFLDAKYIGKLEQVMPKIADWLLGHPGYQRLEDSYFPDVYRMAYFANGAEFVSLFNEYGEGTLVFNCAPEKFYKYGERPVTLTNGQVLKNPSSFEACPLITVTGSGTGYLSCGNGTVEITSIGGSVTIDVKTHRAYNGSTSRNSTIKGQYEYLKLGKQPTITWSGGVTGVTMIPRWWTI